MSTSKSIGGRPPKDPLDACTQVAHFAASRGDIELVHRLVALTAARSVSAAIRGAIRNEYERQAHGRA